MWFRSVLSSEMSKRTWSSQWASFSLAFHRILEDFHTLSLLAALIMVGNGESA
jgi:hypothetical protein